MGDMAGGSTLEDTSPDQRFGRIYGAYHLEIYGYLRRRTDADTARDASAETFLVLWRRLGDAPDGEGVRPWLYGIARKALANQQRSQRRFLGLRRRLSNVAENPPANPSPEAVVVRASEIREVDDAMERLSPADQELLRLVAWEELPHEDIGIILGCKPHAVDQRLLRAKRRLEHELRRSDYAEQLNEWAISTEAGGAS
jgi:RNA polymerase sigma-70 factor (ECF subfamily)